MPYLGRLITDTARVAERMTAFNPDETWKKVDTTALD
jgi:hypothetical protein